MTDAAGIAQYGHRSAAPHDRPPVDRLLGMLDTIWRATIQTPIWRCQQLIDNVGEDLVDAVGILREGFVVHVFQGRETGVFSDNEFGENGSDG